MYSFCLAFLTHHHHFEIYPCCWCIKNYLFLLTSVPLYEYMTVCFCVHLLKDIRIVSRVCC